LAHQKKLACGFLTNVLYVGLKAEFVVNRDAKQFAGAVEVDGSDPYRYRGGVCDV